MSAKKLQKKILQKKLVWKIENDEFEKESVKFLARFFSKLKIL